MAATLQLAQCDHQLGIRLEVQRSSEFKQAMMGHTDGRMDRPGGFQITVNGFGDVVACLIKIRHRPADGCRLTLGGNRTKNLHLEFAKVEIAISGAARAVFRQGGVCQ